MENASDDFPEQKTLENLLPNFAGSSPPILPKTSPTSLWKSMVLGFIRTPPSRYGIELGLTRQIRKKLAQNPFLGHFSYF